MKFLGPTLEFLLAAELLGHRNLILNKSPIRGLLPT